MANLTLEDIAKLAGVSRSTVSRVINNHPNVSEIARERVRSVVSQTGFHPNLAARSLALQRSYILGLVIPRSVNTFFADPYFPRLTEGIAQACNNHGFTLSLFLFYTEEDERNLFPRLCRRGLVDGTIIQSTHAEDEMFDQLSKSEVPYVVAGRPMHVNNASYVDVDNVSGAYTAVRHLAMLGYKRIANIAAPMVTTTGIDRMEGYRKGLKESGLRFDPDLVVESDFTEDGGYYSTQRLLPCKPDAIFVDSDMMAVGALRALRDKGLNVPDDIGIVGYDDLPPARQASPMITTIRQPIRRLGVQLVETLLDIIENGPIPPRRIIFGTELIIRESCGMNRIVNKHNDRQKPITVPREEGRR
ncbi:MAG: LacI family transcriptional regulator [Chloroflexi bacterium]|nr:MAG: LacI family transcriptional regulator [Chloroflexota bacterium]